MTGSSFSYTITVANGVPDAATNAVVKDTLPSSLDLVSATSSQGNCSGTTTITCSPGTINSGANVTITLTVDAPVTVTVSNTATVSSAQADPNATNNAATAVVQVATPIPTLSDMMLGLSVLLLSGVALVRRMRGL